MHDRPHLAGRPVAELPRPPQEHLRQPVRRRDQRVHAARPASGVDPLDGETGPFPDLAKHLPRAGRRLGRGRRRELRRGLVARARGDGAALPQRQGHPRAQLRPHPRDEPEEAGDAAAHVRRPRRLRPDRGRTTSCRFLGLADLAPDTPGRRADRQARRHRPSTSRRTTRSAPSRSSGSRPAAPSTSSANGPRRRNGLAAPAVGRGVDAGRGGAERRRAGGAPRCATRRPSACSTTGTSPPSSATCTGAPTRSRPRPTCAPRPSPPRSRSAAASATPAPRPGRGSTRSPATSSATTCAAGGCRTATGAGSASSRSPSRRTSSSGSRSWSTPSRSGPRSGPPLAQLPAVAGRRGRAPGGRGPRLPRRRRARLGCSEGAARVRVSRGLNRLADLMEAP